MDGVGLRQSDPGRNDNDFLRDSISMLLSDSKDFTLCGSFPHCLNATNDIEKCNPDVVIMDIDMPGINGIEGVINIRKKMLKFLFYKRFIDKRIFITFENI